MIDEDREDLREEMVARTIAARDVDDDRVLDAMRTVPRHVFVPEDHRDDAYDDSPLPIGEGQTISQPYIVALMAQAAALGPGDRVLEVGTGSGYAAAVFAQIAGHVFTIERHASLTEGAKQALSEAGVRNVTVRTGDGTRGWSEEAPFDAIIVAAGAPVVPDALKQQLAVGGRLVIPVDAGDHQELTCIRRNADGSFVSERGGAVTFVPLVGARGVSES